MFLVIVGAVLLCAIGTAALYDHRAMRLGWRASPSTEEAFNYRLDGDAWPRAARDYRVSAKTG